MTKPSITITKLNPGIGTVLLVRGGKLTTSALFSLENLFRHPNAKIAIVELVDHPDEWRYELDKDGELMEVAAPAREDPSELSDEDKLSALELIIDHIWENVLDEEPPSEAGGRYEYSPLRERLDELKEND